MITQLIDKVISSLNELKEALSKPEIEKPHKKILIISVHPDDETLSFGGLMARAKRRGDNVHVHCFCVGGPCSNKPKAVRLEELTNVTNFFGAKLTIDERELDGRLDTIPNCELTGIIDKMIEEERPDEVYCTALSEHSDHLLVYRAFEAAARLKAGYMPKLFAVGVYPFSNQLYTEPVGGKIFQPLEEEDFEAKCKAFTMHKSQIKPSPSPLGIDGIRNQAHYNGMMCGCEYAELYYQLRYIRCRN